MAKKVFPKVIYVKWDGDDEPYLVAEPTLKALSEAEVVKVAAYTLTEQYELRAVEEVRRQGSKRWIR